MTLARSALRDLGSMVALLGRRCGLPEIPACRRQADARPASENAAALPPAGVLEALRRELFDACRSGEGAAGLAPRTLSRAPLVLWNGEAPAAGFPGLLDVFLRHAQRRARWQRDLIEAWLRDFALDRTLLPETGHAITRLVMESRHPRLAVWREAHAKFALFDAAQGPRRVGQAILLEPAGVAAVLRAIGMDDPLRADGRFFRAAVAECLKELPALLRGPSAEQVWDRAKELLEVTRTQRDRLGHEMTRPALRFSDLAGEMARACLDPWTRGENPGAAPKEPIKSFLIRVLGDPRVEPARWAAVGEEATSVMRAWLAAASLEAFLSLISQTNGDSQWRYRQAFWRACLRKYPAAEVWVVLGSAIAARAKAIRALEGGFGQMEAGGANADQAVLLIRMGNLVMSEWSNVGPVRAWASDGRECPPLYRSRYTSAELRTVSLDFPDHPVRRVGGSYGGKGLHHRSGKDGLWQMCAALLLFHRLQISLQPRDYMP